MVEKVFLKRTNRILAGHPWIFSNDLQTTPKQYKPGSLVEVYDMRKLFLGIGYINPNSLISIRLLTRTRDVIDAGFLRKRISGALHYRGELFSGNSSFRVIFSEGDFLPGLIVDKYADCIVVQFLTLGMEMMRDIILNLLDELLSPKVIVIRNDSRSRALEGLHIEKILAKGSLDGLPHIEEHGVTFEVHPLLGQKTGFYLDQRANRIALSEVIRGGTGLDLFCYSGAWALHLAKNGAYVKGVDNSEAAVSQAKKNAELNGLTENCDFVKSDVFDFLKEEIASATLYDFIILDPPAFVKSKGRLKEALKGYEEINTMAMKIVRDGGVIATSSCSYHVDRMTFLSLLRDAARKAKRTAHLLDYRYQGRDHPILLSVPETEYLKCAFIRL